MSISVLIADQIRDALAECRDRHFKPTWIILGQQDFKPAWIILGQQDWYDLKRESSRETVWALLPVDGPDVMPRFEGVPVAIVNVSRHIEVVPALP